MQIRHPYSRLVPSVMALALAAVSSAQVSNVSAFVQYNNQETGTDFASSVVIGQDFQFDSAQDNLSASVSSPSTMDTFFGTGGSGVLKAHSAMTSALSFDPTFASISGRAFTQSEVISTDDTTYYYAAASADSYMNFHLGGTGSVFFTVDPFSGSADDTGECTLIVDNVTVGNFATAGIYQGTLGGGDHTIDVWFHSEANGGIFRPADDHATFSSGDYNLTVASVPEPTTIAVLATGIGAMLRRRRKN